MCKGVRLTTHDSLAPDQMKPNRTSTLGLVPRDRERDINYSVKKPLRAFSALSSLPRNGNSTAQQHQQFRALSVHLLLSEPES